MTLPVPLLDLKAQHDAIRGDLLRALEEVVDSQHFILGPQVAELEKAVAAAAQVPHAVGCASGSDALILALMAGGFQPGDAVVTVPFTFFATAGAISRLGGFPFFIDIDPATYNLNVDLLRQFLESQCVQRDGRAYHRASGRRLHSVIPVHLFGQCVDMDPLLALCRQWHLLVIEDAAQAIGARYDNRPAGSMGDFGCFSFFPSKNLGAMGDGGMVVTSNPEFADRLRILRVHGSKPKYYHKVVGMNSRLDTLQAAVLLVKLRYLDQWAERRHHNAAVYDQRFAGLSPRLQIPRVHPKNHMIYNQYCIRTPARDELRRHLQDQKIGTEIYYPVPLHLQECFSDLGYHAGDFPESEKAASEILALPIFPELSAAQRSHVADQIVAFMDRKRQPANA